MKMRKLWIVVFVCVCFCQLYAQATYNNVRAAYFGLWSESANIPQRFYERAKANGYNYVLAEFTLSDSSATVWDSGRYVGGTTSGIYKQIRNTFVAADSNGMKLIPLFQTSSMHSRHWRFVRNGYIDWQDLPAGVPQHDGEKRVVPTFARDPENVFGADSSFKELLGVIYSAFAGARAMRPNSKILTNLDYIHIGADEPVHIDKRNPHSYIAYAMVGLCPNDRSWLQNKGFADSTSQAQTIALLADNIYRKVEMVHDVGIRNKHKTITLYYGDMFDPGVLGNTTKLRAFSDLFDPSASNTVPITTMSLASHPSIQAVSNRSMVVQWNYGKRSLFADGDYNTLYSFNHFKNDSLRFLHGNAVADEDYPIYPDRMVQFMNQAVTSALPQFKNYVHGFVSFHWCTDNNVFSGNDRLNKVASYKTMEFLSHTLRHTAAIYD